VGRAQSSTRAGNSQGWTGEGHNGLAWFLGAPRREGGGAESTPPAHTARDSQLCPQRLLARGPASTRLSLLPSGLQIPLPVSSLKSWTITSSSCSGIFRGAPVPRRGALLLFKAPYHLLSIHPSDGSFHVPPICALGSAYPTPRPKPEVPALSTNVRRMPAMEGAGG